MILFLMLAMVAPPCHSLEHNRILGSDLAAASAQFAAMPPNAVVSNGPRPGARRLFEPAELIRVARENNLQVSGVTPVCFERATALLDAKSVEAAMRKSLGAVQAGIEILALSNYPAPHGELVFPHDSLLHPASGDTAIWNGYVIYDGGHFSVWAKLRLTMPQTRLVSVVDLKPGHVIEASDVRVEQASEFPRRRLPLTTPEAAIGLTARRKLPAGSALEAAMLMIPNDVERGETVIVEVRSGKALVKLEAKAESSGHSGDTVAVRNAASGTLLHAQIEGKGRVFVKCQSTSEVSQ
jgi:flagella basal body P-ring formation protein FlgA